MVEHSQVINVNVTFLNLDSTDYLKSYASDKLTNVIQKFCQKDTEVHVVLKVEKNRQIAEVSFHASGADFAVKEESDNLYASIDAMIDTLTQQMRKHKEKVTSHH